MNRVQLSQLAVLSAVAEGRSFRKAAAELGIAPSAVSHAVSSLEASLAPRVVLTAPTFQPVNSHPPGVLAFS